MKLLQDILRIVGSALDDRKNEQVYGLSFDSRKTKPQELFFAIPGYQEDGMAYIPAAKAKGAISAIVPASANIPEELRGFCFPVPDVRLALAQASQFFFDYPSRQLACFGVTGTKGKTSTAFILESILKAAGHKPALAGTIVCRYPGFSEEASRTTMESLELQTFLRAGLDHAVTAAAIEISSHALSLHRVTGMQFCGVLFTNLSADHLDFYGDMESYFRAKLKLFTEFAHGPARALPLGVTNLDDPYGVRVKSEAKIPTLGFGIKTGDYSMPDANSTAHGISGTIRCPNGERVVVNSSLVGHFNVTNILGAVALLHACGLPVAALEKGIADLRGIPGRLERVPTDLPFQVFVDFAHTGAALENVLQTLRPFCQNRLTVLFGAGGDKNPARRAQQGRVASLLADQAWITSDNPRTEDPQKIIDAIVEAFQATGGPCKGFVQADRLLAIEAALKDAQAGDIVCLAGKGHEWGQIVGTTVLPFDDRLEAAKVLRSLEAEHNT